MEATQKNLKLCVERTFLHVKDVNVEASKMSTSKSDPRSDACQDLGSDSDVVSDFLNHDCCSSTSTDVSSRCGSQRPKGGLAQMETSHKSFQLCVRWNCIDEKDLDVEACKIRASKSDPRSDACQDLGSDSDVVSDFLNHGCCSSTSTDVSSRFGSQRPKGGLAQKETAHKNFQLCVKGTFIDEKDLEVEACKIRASKSDPRSDACKEPDLCSQSLSDFETSDWCSITSAEGSSCVSSNYSGSQRQQPARLPNGEKLGGLLRDQPRTGSMTEDKVGPVDPSWSEGSELHESGQCKPCAWLFKAKGCSLGSKCNFCHLCPSTAAKAKRKDKDAQLRQQRIEREQKALPPGREKSAAQSSKHIVFL